VITAACTRVLTCGAPTRVAYWPALCHRRGIRMRLACLLMLLALSACERREAPPATTPGPARAPTSSVTPQPVDTPASGATGPTGGSTAIGGMAAHPGEAPGGKS